MKKITINAIIVLLLSQINIYAKKIADIPEASGICYVEKSNSLFVVNDEGTLYEIAKKGKIKRKVYLGDYDLEGITYDKRTDTLLLAVEGEESILIVNRKNFKIIKNIKIKRKYKNIKLLKRSKKTGVEAIAIDKNGDIYLSNQSSLTYTKKLKENVSLVFKIDGLDKKKAKITKVFNHKYKDISGLTFYDGYLYMVSDKKNLLIKYDIKTNRTIKKVKLEKYAQEGICFDDNGNIYIADDNGRVVKYKKGRLKINM